MDQFVTGIPPQPSGHLVTIRLRPNVKSSFKDGESLTVRSNPLTATSQYFLHDLHRNWASHVLEFVWPDPIALESYLRWTQDRIVHRFPTTRQGSPGGGKDRPFKDKTATVEKGVTEDYDTLIRLCLLGHRLWDSVFQDLTISMLDESIRLPERDIELFFRALTPTLLTMVYAYSDRTSKLRAFLLDTIAQYANHQRTRSLMQDPVPTYPPVFMAELFDRLSRSAALHILPEGTKLGDVRRTRILLPTPPYKEEMIGVESTPCLGISKEPYDPTLLSGHQLQKLASWVVKQDVDSCRYHQHDDLGRCWLTWLD